MIFALFPLSPKEVTQKVSIKNDKVSKDISTFIKLYSHQKTYKQYSYDNLFYLVLSISGCNFISESRFLCFLHSL